jgi:class 3 adenylate cyclase
LTAPPSFIARLRLAGISPDDPEELRIRKSVLVFAMGLMTAAPMFWLALYWTMGLQLSATVPFAYQLISVATFLVYVRGGYFGFFSYAQLALFLFFPFIVQLGIGSFITSSGAVLWGVVAPVVAVLVLGGRESIPWFVAFVALLAICGYIDFDLVGVVRPRPNVPLKTSAVFLMLNFMAISGLVYFLLRYAEREKRRYEVELSRTNTLLTAEQEKSERLLLNILPGAVAERLKEQNATIADGFADVTVMFADIVNFTQLAGGMSPNQIFSMLNAVFSAFDELAEKHGLEKIKTIGDAYMVAGGLNGQDEQDYTRAIANLALDMRQALAHDPRIGPLQLEIRIGIGTGPVVAGVVGRKKFIYDLWGDTVNLASRITSEGGPGAIQVDSMTWKRLRQHYDFQPPQTLYLKGKGETVVYRLLAPATHAAGLQGQGPVPARG